MSALDARPALAIVQVGPNDVLRQVPPAATRANLEAVLVELRRCGVSILLVEQNARAALEISDYACVMELGRVVKHGPAAEIAVDPKLVESYLGLGGVDYDDITEETQ